VADLVYATGNSYLYKSLAAAFGDAKTDGSMNTIYVLKDIACGDGTAGENGTAFAATAAGQNITLTNWYNGGPFTLKPTGSEPRIGMFGIVLNSSMIFKGYGSGGLIIDGNYVENTRETLLLECDGNADLLQGVLFRHGGGTGIAAIGVGKDLGASVSGKLVLNGAYLINNYNSALSIYDGGQAVIQSGYIKDTQGDAVYLDHDAASLTITGGIIEDTGTGYAVYLKIDSYDPMPVFNLQGSNVFGTGMKIYMNYNDSSHYAKINLTGSFFNTSNPVTLDLGPGFVGGGAERILTGSGISSALPSFTVAGHSIDTSGYLQ
jgi:hypothetical protein